MVTRGRAVLVWSAVLVLVGASLACSFSWEVDMSGSNPTSPPEEKATTEATEQPSPTDTPKPAEATEPAEESPTEVAPTEESEPEPTAPPPTEAPAEPTEAPTPEPTLPPETVEEKDPLEVAKIPELEVPEVDPSAGGMGHLGTFRQRANIRFTAEDASYTSVLNYDAEVNTGDQAVHVALSAEGPAADELPSNTIEVIWVGTRVWVKIGNQPWVPVPEDVSALPFDEQVLAVGDFMPYVQYFQRVDEREMNGVACAYYTYTADNVPSKYGTVSGNGDVCVALDGGYVVHYTLKGHGTFESDEFFQGSGALDLVYDTYDVGAPITIEAPRAR
jgi:hypothetical protein